MNDIKFPVGTKCIYRSYTARVKIAMNMIDGSPRRFIEFQLVNGPMMTWVHPDELRAVESDTAHYWEGTQLNNEVQS